MVTIKDIAKKVGVSATTVSRVLNYDSSLSVSETKRRQIIETAEDLDYTTPRMRNMARAKPQILSTPISLMHFLEPTEELADPYYITVRHSIEKRLSELGHRLSGQYHGARSVPGQLLEDNGAVIVVGPHREDVIDGLLEHGLHCIFVDFPPERRDVDCVYPDLAHAMTDLLDQLWTHGMRRFAFIGSTAGSENPGRPFPEYRLEAFRNWFRTRGTDLPEQIRLLDLSPLGGFELTRDLLVEGTPPDVLIAANDTMAIGAIRAAASMNIRIPEDMRIVGFNDIPAAELVNPSLTTVGIPAAEIGRSAVNLLIERLEGRSHSKRLIVGTRVRWRQSC